MRARSKLSLALSLSSLALVACGGACPEASATTAATSGSESAPTLRDPNAAPESITVTIGGLDAAGRFADTQVFSGFGCTGGNQSPELSWTGAPEGTQAYAIVMHDPDAPTGVGFFHWVLTDLPAGTTQLAAGAASAEGGLPAGVIQAYTDFGANGYGGPCPPPGAPHRYEITVYALDTASLGVPAGATGALVRFMLGQHTLALGRATATYGR